MNENSTSLAQGHTLDVNQIMQLIPHRPPMLMVDKIIHWERDSSITGIKNVSINEPHFAGHFPNLPVMPGVLIIEAMAQTGAVLISLMHEKERPLALFRRIEKTKFTNTVVPGDVLQLKLELIRRRGVIWQFKGTAQVDEASVASAHLHASVVSG